MNYIERIQRSIDFIETHLAEEINLNDVAQQAYMSLASFYRLFYGFTGCSAKEYIRMRRLSNAAIQLTMSDCPAVQIALESGFESQESFIKAFKAAVGVTPSRYRHQKRIMPYHFERMNLMNKHFVQTDEKLAEAYPDVRILKDFPAMRVAACWIFSDQPEGEAHQKLVAWGEKQGLLDPERGYRIFGHDTPAFMGMGHGYEFWLNLPDDFQMDPDEAAKDGIVFKEIPSAKYIIISTSFAHLMEGKDRGARFIRDSQYGFAYSPYLEEHIMQPDEDPNDFHLDLYFPISDDASTKEPVEVNLPAMRVAVLEVKDGNEFERAWKMYEQMIQSGCSEETCKLYSMHNGLNKMWAGPIELWISLPEGVAAPEGLPEKMFEGGRYMRYPVQYTALDSEVEHCYEMLTQRGYKHSRNQLVVQYADYSVTWEDQYRTYLNYPVK